jgi:hypothetical protein
MKKVRKTFGLPDLLGWFGPRKTPVSSAKAALTRGKSIFSVTSDMKIGLLDWKSE